MAFVKLHDSILDSSLMEEDIHVRWVWVGMLSITDQDGIVRGTVNALARRLNVSIDQMEDALRVLMEPDPESTSDDEDGRRLVMDSPNRWRVVNYAFYRKLASYEDRKDYQREYQREWQRKRRTHNESNDVEHDVNNFEHVERIAEVEAEVEEEEEGETQKPKRKRFVPPTHDEVKDFVSENGLKVDPADFVDFYQSKDWMVGKSKMKDWRAACRRAEKWESNQRKFGGVTGDAPSTSAWANQFDAKGNPL